LSIEIAPVLETIANGSKATVKPIRGGSFHHGHSKIGIVSRYAPLIQGIALRVFHEKKKIKTKGLRQVSGKKEVTPGGKTAFDEKSHSLKVFVLLNPSS